jgi:hypothetical protein
MTITRAPKRQFRQRSTAALLLLLVPGSTSVTVAHHQAETSRSKTVTAAQVNGVWRSYDNYFRILALGHNKLKVQFAGVYHTISKSVNTGDLLGEATIEGNVATLVPEDTQGCKITMTFLPGKLVVKQDGPDVECGFGHNVRSDGTYKKIRSGKPNFETPP